MEISWPYVLLSYLVGLLADILPFQSVDNLMRIYLRSLVLRLPAREFTELLVTYITERQDPTSALSLWQKLLAFLGGGELQPRHLRASLSLLLDKVHQNALPTTLKP